MFAVTAEPTQAFVDAISARLRADTELGRPDSLATLMGLQDGAVKVFGHLSESKRVAYPYLAFGRTSNPNDAGTMGIAGGNITVQIDGWSNAKGPYQIRRVKSRVFALLERKSLPVVGFTLLDGSLHCELNEDFDEPDEDKPESRLYRMVQRWTAEIHEAA